MIISGWNFLMIQTTSLNIFCSFHIFKCFRSRFGKSKIICAGKKLFCPVNTLLAAINSWVRISPSSIPCSSPIRFWPPSPRVMINILCDIICPWKARPASAYFHRRDGRRYIKPTQALQFLHPEKNIRRIRRFRILGNRIFCKRNKQDKRKVSNFFIRKYNFGVAKLMNP